MKLQALQFLIDSKIIGLSRVKTVIIFAATRLGGSCSSFCQIFAASAIPGRNGAQKKSERRAFLFSKMACG